MNIKKIIASTGAAAAMFGFAAVTALAVGAFDRGLPTDNLNNAAGADRSNVAWSNGNDYVSGDTFTVGNPGEKWIVTGIRTWNIGHLGNEFNDEFSDVKLYFGTGLISEVLNPTVTHTAAQYTGNINYQGSSGDYRQIWQNDFTDLNIPVNGGETYYFAVDGTATDYYWFNHASNKDKSDSTQKGADDHWVAWDKANLNTPNMCDSGAPTAGVCDGGWDKSSDINVQVFAVKIGKSTGGVKATAGSVKLQLNFEAHNEVNGVKGNVMYSNSTGSNFKGDVNTCYDQDGNEAAFAGEVTSGTYSQKYFQIDIQDNGQGKNADPDKVRVRLADTPYDCSISGSFPGVVTTGNLVVHN